MLEGSGMKEKILEKILELLQQMPDSEDQPAEVLPEEGAAVEGLVVEADPDKKVC